MSEHFISRTDAERDLLSLATYLAERITSVDGHAEAISAVVPQYLEKGEVDLAAELSNTVADPFTRDRLLIAVAEKCAEMDDDDYALQLADSVEEPGLRTQAFERVGLQKAAKGEFEKAHEITESMTDADGVRIGIAVRQGAMGLDEDAKRTIEEIEHPGAAVTALIDMSGQRLEAQDAEKAVELLRLAVEEAADIEHKEEQSRAYIDIGNAFTEAGRLDLAIETLDKAKSTAETIDNVHRDGFLGLTAVGFLHAGSLELADRTLDLVSDKTHIANSLLGYSREFWRKNERDDALESLEEAHAMLESQHERETRDSRAKFRLFTQIAAQFAGFERGERAIEVAERIKDDGERTSALSQVAAILATRNEDEQARQAFRSIADDGDRVFALIGMSDAKQRNDDRSSAMSLLDEAYQLAETVPQLSFRAAAYNEIGRRYGSLGETSRSRDAFRESLETIEQIRDASTRAVSIASLARMTAETDFTIDESLQPTFQTLAASAGR